MTRALDLRGAVSRLYAASVLALVVGATANAQTQDLSAWLPADTAVVLNLKSPDALLPLRDSWNLPGLLEKQPAIQAVYDNKDLNQARMVFNLIAGSLRTTPEQLFDDLAGNGACVALEGKDKYLLMLRPRQPQKVKPTIDAVLDLMRQDARSKNQPEPFQIQEIQGRQVVVFSPQGAVSILDGNLIAAPSVERIRAIIESGTGSTPSSGTLAADSDFVKFQSQVDPNAAAWFFARLDRLRLLDPNGMKKPSPNDEAGGRFVLGRWFELIWAARLATGQVVVGPETLAARIQVDVPPEVQNGPLDVTRPHETGAAEPELAPGTLLSVTYWRDFAALWEVRDQWLSAESLKGLAQLDTLAGQFFGGRDFGTGVLGALGQDWSLVVAHPDYEAQKPAPSTRYPGVALVMPIDADDNEFALRLLSAYQSFVGLVNLGAAQEKAPPLMLGSEQVGKTTLLRAAYIAQQDAVAGEPVDDRFNFSPSAAQIGDRFVLATNVDVARAVLTRLESKPQAVESPAAGSKNGLIPTLRALASGAEAARSVHINREALISRTVLQKGSSRDTAAREVDLIEALLKLVRTARLDVAESADVVRADLVIERGEVSASN